MGFFDPRVLVLELLVDGGFNATIRKVIASNKCFTNYAQASSYRRTFEPQFQAYLGILPPYCKKSWFVSGRYSTRFTVLNYEKRSRIFELDYNSAMTMRKITISQLRYHDEIINLNKQPVVRCRGSSIFLADHGYASERCHRR